MLQTKDPLAVTLPKGLSDIFPKELSYTEMREIPCSVALYPETQEDTEKLEDFLAKEMASLSIDERDKILFDVHGFSEPEEEDEDNLDQLLEEMESAILKSKLNKDAYIEAKYMNEAYATNRAFCLMFLRSERYDPVLAAERLFLHFKEKRTLFGSGDILGRDIRLSDLSDDDMALLKSGHMQVLSSRDVAGRCVLCCKSPPRSSYKTVDNLARSCWYLSMTTLRDEETQKNGVVFVGFNDNTVSKIDEIAVSSRMHPLRSGIPQKIVSGHYCYTDSSLRPFVAGMRFFLGKDVRNRFRAHVGTYKELLFTLQTYGIDTKVHPMKEDGTLSLTWHNEWLQMRRSQEESNLLPCPTSDISVPRRFDVLFGRGKNVREHTGNLRAAHLVEMYQQKYEEANRYQKTEIAERVVGIIYDSYGRFLKWEDDGWVEVDYDAAREKISHFFRHNRSKKLTGSKA